MAFTRALYYPWIDVTDEGWLKNAALYWENIQTIVPASIAQPYKAMTARELNDEGILLPFRVHSNMPEIHELTADVVKYLESPEGVEVLLSREIREFGYIHPDKLPGEIRQLVDIHPDKLPNEIRHRLERDLNHDRKDQWIPVDLRFADFYMTLLAVRLSDRVGAGLLTDTEVNSRLAAAARLDAKLVIPRGRAYHNIHVDMPPSLAQGSLADLILESVQIDPATPTSKILKFRKEHGDELGRLRTKIAELTATISNDQPRDRLSQQIHDIYSNEVQPALHSLKKGLTDLRIRWVAENFLKVTFFSASATSIPLAVIGLSVPVALLVGAGVSLTASAIMYNRQKEEKLREHPFSYLLAAEKVLR